MVIMVRAADFRRALFSPPGFILYGLVFGTEALRSAVPPHILRIFIALGLVLYAGVGVATLLMEADFLAYNALSQDPVAGQHLGIFLVELGVGITVGAVMITVFLGFAGRNDP